MFLQIGERKRRKWIKTEKKKDQKKDTIAKRRRGKGEKDKSEKRRVKEKEMEKE